MYKVYAVPSRRDYAGYSFVAANSAEEANRMIEAFKESDSSNFYDSYGYGSVDEEDAIDSLHADHDGFIFHGIYYHPV